MPSASGASRRRPRSRRKRTALPGRKAKKMLAPEMAKSRGMPHISKMPVKISTSGLVTAFFISQSLLLKKRAQ